ncbi:MAG: glycosyl transferase, partial [Acidobacteriota bacterium]
MTLTTVLLAVALAVALAGAVLTTVQTGLAVRRVSILKPLSGLDDGLEENLASFAVLTGVSHEIILSVAHEDDPAVAVARRVIDRFPAAPFRLVLGGGPSVLLSNPKVERLVVAARVARGEILFVSDSN